MDHVTILLRQSPVGPGTDCSTLVFTALPQYSYPSRWFQPAGVILFSFILFLSYFSHQTGEILANAPSPSLDTPFGVLLFSVRNVSTFETVNSGLTNHLFKK